jgi:hypothetical protein
MENPENGQKKPDEGKNIRDKKVLGLMLWETGLEFGVMLALPLIIFVYLGKWLDTKYNRHFFVVIGLFPAIGLSCYMIYRKIKDLKRIIK